MPVRFGLTQVARLIGEPSRAMMLSRLLEGTAWTAGELARMAGVTPQTASSHLSLLREGGLVQVEAQGRHRYYRLGGADVAQALEALSLLAPTSRVSVHAPQELRFARTCYDHLAGRLGVELADALVRRSYLFDSGEAYAVTPEGEAFLARLDVDVATLQQGRRPLARRCLDWSERRAHVAGALGAVLAQRFFALKWIARVRDGRGVRLTVAGRVAFERTLGLRW